MAAISEQSPAETDGEAVNPIEDSSNPLGWKSFDMRAVVSATEDLLLFVLSEKGSRVRVFLLRDMVEAADAFMQDEVLADILDKSPYQEVRQTSVSKVFLPIFEFEM